MQRNPHSRHVHPSYVYFSLLCTFFDELRLWITVAFASEQTCIGLCGKYSTSHRDLFPCVHHGTGEKVFCIILPLNVFISRPCLILKMLLSLLLLNFLILFTALEVCCQTDRQHTNILINSILKYIFPSYSHLDSQDSDEP